MEKLVLDGKEFVKASRAAKDLGYTSDYVGQLCRSGKVSAHLVGRSWYVNVDELGSHKVEKKRISRTKAREQAKKAIAEHKAKRLAVVEAPTKHVAIKYESDDSALIPETRKLTIESEKAKKSNVKKSNDDNKGPKYIVENEGNKIVMKGSLDIVDVTDGEIDPHTTLLSPKIIYSKSEEEVKKEVNVKIEDTEKLDTSLKSKTDFKDRLVERGAVTTEKEQAPEERTDETELTVRSAQNTESKNSVWGTVVWILCLVLITATAAITLAISATKDYKRTEANNPQRSYEVSFEKMMEIIRLRI